MPVIDKVKEWSPFNIDAVGLVTLLGANTLDKCLGRLVRHPWGECFPLLAGHIVPDHLLFETIPGFTLYNITDGIKVDGVNAWFSRWLVSQKLDANSTVLHISSEARRRKTQAQDIISISLGFLIHAFPLIFCVLIHDWYGFAAAVSLALSTLTRVLTLRSARKSLKQMLKQGNELSTLPVKVLLRLPNQKTVTVHTTRGIVIKCIVAEIKPENATVYSIFRVIGWAAFGIFILALGMACLAIQIIVVVIMLVSTIIVIKRIGCDDSLVGDHLHINMHTMEGVGTHKRTYAALSLTEKEEDALVTWSLFPLRSNKQWWGDYYKFSQEYTQSPTVVKMLGPPLTLETVVSRA